MKFDAMMKIRIAGASASSRNARTSLALNRDPMTFWRRVLLGRVRARQLIRDELPASLAALGRASAVGPG